MDIYQALKERGFDTVAADYYKHINTWMSWYVGEVKSFHNYTVYTGQNKIQCKRYTMGMAKKVCEDWANLLMNEKVKITLEGEAEQAWIDEVFAANRFLEKASEMQEVKMATGTAAYIPSVVGMTVTEDGAMVGAAEGIRIDYCPATNIYPLAWENGAITECAFAAQKVKGDKKYLYLQIHHKQGGVYVIENALYENTHGDLRAAKLTDLPELERVPEQVQTGSDKPQFVIDKPNIANNIDLTIPLGVSVYANAIDQLKGVDIAWDSYVNEFVLGKKRIMAKVEATKWIDGNPAFDPNDIVFYVLPEDSAGTSAITPIDMSLRTADHNAGLQDMLNALSAKCGFGERHYSFDNGSLATATQVISANSEMFRTIKKHEIILERVLTELCRTLLRMGNTYMGQSLDEDVEISIDFDDSIIEDKDREFQRTLQLLAAGLMTPVEARAILMNEDEETAAAALPTMEQLTDEEQSEIE